MASILSICAKWFSATLQLPLEGEHPFYCLIETSGSNSEHDSEKLNTFLEHVMGEEIVVDGVVAESESQVQSLWVR